MSDSLQGRWIYILDGEYGIAGPIMMADGADYYLVRMVHHHGPPVSRLMSRDELCSDAMQDYYVSIFDNETELKARLAWVESDSRPKVVKMQKDRKPPVW